MVGYYVIKSLILFCVYQESQQILDDLWLMMLFIEYCCVRHVLGGTVLGSNPLGSGIRGVPPLPEGSWERQMSIVGRRWMDRYWTLVPVLALASDSSLCNVQHTCQAALR